MFAFFELLIRFVTYIFITAWPIGVTLFIVFQLEKFTNQFTAYSAGAIVFCLCTCIRFFLAAPGAWREWKAHYLAIFSMRGGSNSATRLDG